MILDYSRMKIRGSGDTRIYSAIGGETGGVRKVTRYGFVSYQRKRYSESDQYAGRSVVLETQDARVTVRLGSECLCSHVVVPGRLQMVREKRAL
jgi:hypothetical protein